MSRKPVGKFTATKWSYGKGASPSNWGEAADILKANQSTPKKATKNGSIPAAAAAPAKPRR